MNAADVLEIALSTLTPAPGEIFVGGASLLHLALVLGILAMVFAGKARVPFGLLGIVALFLVPVLGPLLVLDWNRRARGFRPAA